MSKRNSALLLQDILEAIETIGQYVSGFSEDQFEADKKTVDAVVRNLEIIGEAAGRLTDDVKEKYPDTEWGKIVGLRNRIIHEYFGIDLKIVWTILEQDIPRLKESLKKVPGN